MTDDLFIQGRRGFTPLLTADGVTIRYGWRSSRYAWRDISGEFRPAWRYVVFDLTPEALAGHRLRTMLAFVQRKLFGFDAGIDPAPYKVPQRELLRLLNERRRSGGQA